MISNCGHDENGRYSGGKAGDQTGTEWQVINWYSRPWKCVLRHPNAKVRAMIASMAKAAAVNNKIGYCQSHRGTFWTNLADSNFDPAQITVACEADCSSGVAAIVKGAGYRLGIDALMVLTQQQTSQTVQSHPEREHPTQHQSRATQRLMLHTDSTRALQEHTR